ncbi:low-density lipoprotein receptor class A domain-containing protein 1-like isoform X1 [Myxocyprinus asiaticus]|uniref:low-density lipoprotein receptor class A domain-containing protein 1-like isoform X1 n=1 Tax=Myxocyprinus asiaticus TaxID=70543 RepID=UPI00222240FC|nr:low-density lipoprotein receptor class A domain-containing protein 1-like isoform X1 [Myxocyprinus asiaticus]
MKPNRTCPQFEKSETQEEDCYGECCSCRCCTRRAACISGILLSCMIFSAVVLVLVFAIPEPPPINRDCRTPQNGSGFLCDDRVTCIPPSDLCNGAPNCPSGTDEDKLICSKLHSILTTEACENPYILYTTINSMFSVSQWIHAKRAIFILDDLPNNLPSNIILRCGNPRFWIFIDKKCNFINDCGDCSDETGIYTSCPSCGAEWWACIPVLFQYCECIPQSLCRDGRQHCFDWSDEYICIKD